MHKIWYIQYFIFQNQDSTYVVFCSCSPPWRSWQTCSRQFSGVASLCSSGWLYSFTFSSGVEQLDPEELGLPSGSTLGLVYGVVLIQVHRCCFPAWHSYRSTDKHLWSPQLTAGRNSGHLILQPAPLELIRDLRVLPHSPQLVEQRHVESQPSLLPSIFPHLPGVIEHDPCFSDYGQQLLFSPKRAENQIKVLQSNVHCFHHTDWPKVQILMNPVLARLFKEAATLTNLGGNVKSVLCSIRI